MLYAYFSTLSTMNIYVVLQGYGYGDGDGMVKDIPWDSPMDSPWDISKICLNEGVLYIRRNRKFQISKNLE